MMEAKKEKDVGKIVKTIINRIVPSFQVIFSLSYFSFAIYVGIIVKIIVNKIVPSFVVIFSLSYFSFAIYVGIIVKIMQC